MSFLVPVDDQGIAGKRGRAALAVAVLGVHFAEVLFPKELAVRVQAVKTSGAEEREDVLAIGDGRCRGQAGGDMTCFMRKLLVYRLLPENFASLAAERQYREFVAMGHGQVVMGTGAGRKPWLYGLAVRNRRGEEDTFAPDDRARSAPYPAPPSSSGCSWYRSIRQAAGRRVLPQCRAALATGASPVAARPCRNLPPAEMRQVTARLPKNVCTRILPSGLPITGRSIGVLHEPKPQAVRWPPLP